MVFKKSEYQKQFSERILMKHIPIYEANLECRNRRRDHQFSHTSIAWDDTDLDSPSTSEKDIKEAQEKLENLQVQTDKGCQVTPVSKQHELICASLSNEQFHKCENEPSSEQSKRKSCPKFGKPDLSQKGQKKKQEMNKKRSKRPDRKEKIPCVRPSSAPAHNIGGIQHPKPFLSYGHGDGDKSTGILWSHNVRAGSQVYPSALRAKIHREVEAKKREDRRSKYLWLHERNKNAILKLMKKETQDWETEYQKHYPAYDKMIYERALSARPDSRLEY